MMDFPIQINAIRMGLSIIYYKGSEFLNYDAFLSLNVVLTSAKCEDNDEMQRLAAFHLRLHFLPKYPFRGFQHTKGYNR